MKTFRVTYINSWKETKTIKLSGEGIWLALTDAEMMFGKANVISIDEIDANGKVIPRPDYTTSKFTDFPDYYGSVDNYDD